MKIITETKTEKLSTNLHVSVEIFRDKIKPTAGKQSKTIIINCNFWFLDLPDFRASNKTEKQ